MLILGLLEHFVILETYLNSFEGYILAFKPHLDLFEALSVLNLACDTDFPSFCPLFGF